MTITFKTDSAGRPVTESGKPVTCDGCGAVLTRQPTADEQKPVPDQVALDVYGKAPGVLGYVVCPRGVACLDLAELADDLYDRTRCRTPGCSGDRCQNETNGAHQ